MKRRPLSASGPVSTTEAGPSRRRGRHRHEPVRTANRPSGFRLALRPGLPRSGLVLLTLLAVVIVALVLISGGLRSGKSSARITVCGRQLCRDGKPWYFYGASVHGDYSRPVATTALARQAGLNTIRLTDFISTAGPLSLATDEARWRTVDAMIAQATKAGLYVELDLSCYRDLLLADHQNPYTYDWQPFLRFVTGRINTVDGRAYRTDPTIAVIALAGEVTPINGSGNTLGITSDQVSAFFRRVLGQLAGLDPGAVRTSGGLLYLDFDSGIDWRTIMSDPNNQICQVHDYTAGDRLSTAQVAQYCGGLNKPWATEEFGFNQTDGDARRAQEFQSMFDLQKQNQAAGVGFWNLGFERVGTDGKSESHDVNTGTPLTFRTIQKNAP